MTSEVILHCDQLGVPCEMTWHGGYGATLEFARASAEHRGWTSETTRTIAFGGSVLHANVEDYCPEHAR